MLTASHGLCLPTLALVAQAVVLFEDGHTQTLVKVMNATDCTTDALAADSCLAAWIEQKSN